MDPGDMTEGQVMGICCYGKNWQMAGVTKVPS